MNSTRKVNVAEAAEGQSAYRVVGSSTVEFGGGNRGIVGVEVL
jgi:hypothetical protein